MPDWRHEAKSRDFHLKQSWIHVRSSTKWMYKYAQIVLKRQCWGKYTYRLSTSATGAHGRTSTPERIAVKLRLSQCGWKCKYWSSLLAFCSFCGPDKSETVLQLKTEAWGWLSKNLEIRSTHCESFQVSAALYSKLTLRACVLEPSELVNESPGGCNSSPGFKTKR